MPQITTQIETRTDRRGRKRLFLAAIHPNGATLWRKYIGKTLNAAQIAEKTLDFATYSLMVDAESIVRRCPDVLL